MAKSTRLGRQARQVVLAHATYNHRSTTFKGGPTTVVTRPLTFRDTIETWASVLGINFEDAANANLALRRLATNVAEKTSELEDSILPRLIKDLRGAAQNTNAFVVCLAEAESHGLLFEDLNEAICVFRWIDAQCMIDIKERQQTNDRRRGRRAGRIQKDLKYWETVITTACHLFAHFQGHWSCGLSAKVTHSSRVLITSFELAHTINGIIPPCVIVRVVQTASDVGIGSELIKSLVLAHHPSRLDDWAALIRDGLLTQTTYWELMSRPELVTALSYDGLKRLLTKWQSSDADLVVCAKQMVTNLYPEGVPMGSNPIWEGVPTSLLNFLRAMRDVLLKAGGATFNYLTHDDGPGKYIPGNAAILLSEPPPAAQADTEEVDQEENEPIAALEAELPNPNARLLSFRIDGETSRAEPGLDPDVIELWIEKVDASEAYNALLDERPDSPEPEPAPDPDPTPESESTPWSDIHDLIAMDAREGREGIKDPNLQVLLQDLGEVEHLLDLAAHGETDDVLVLWSAWIDPIRDRIREVDARLIELAARPVTVEVVAAPPAQPEPAPEQDPEPVLDHEPEPAPASVPEPPRIAASVQETPQLPDGELGELLAAAYAALALLPAGGMKRQFKAGLETLRTESLSNGTVRSLKSRIAALHKDITDLLEVISS